MNPNRPAPLVVLKLVPSVVMVKMSKYQNDPLELFLYGIRSNSTKSRYKRRLGNFFDYLEISGDLSEQAKQFIGMAQKNGNTWVSANLMKYLAYHKERAERNEIAVGTLKNYYKPVKAFLEMNDIELSWKIKHHRNSNQNNYRTNNFKFIWFFLVNPISPQNRN